jgi:hypothetical protein
MDRKLLYVAIFLLALIVAGVGYLAVVSFSAPPPVPAPETKEDAPVLSAESVEALARLQETLAEVEPQIVRDFEYDGRPLPRELRQVKEALSAFQVSTDPQNVEYLSNPIYLTSVGKRYLVYRFITEKDVQGYELIFDSVTGQETPIKAEATVSTPRARIYATNQDLCYYAPDAQVCVPVPGAKLSGTDTYDACGGCMVEPWVQVGYTEKELVLDVYDSSTLIYDPEQQRSVPKRVREVRLPLP